MRLLPRTCDIEKVVISVPVRARRNRLVPKRVLGFFASAVDGAIYLPGLTHKLSLCRTSRVACH